MFQFQKEAYCFIIPWCLSGANKWINDVVDVAIVCLCVHVYMCVLMCIRVCMCLELEYMVADSTINFKNKMKLRNKDYGIELAVNVMFLIMYRL